MRRRAEWTLTTLSWSLLPTTSTTSSAAISWARQCYLWLRLPNMFLPAIGSHCRRFLSASWSPVSQRMVCTISFNSFFFLVEYLKKVIVDCSFHLQESEILQLLQSRADDKLATEFVKKQRRRIPHLRSAFGASQMSIASVFTKQGSPALESLPRWTFLLCLSFLRNCRRQGCSSFLVSWSLYKDSWGDELPNFAPPSFSAILQYCFRQGFFCFCF